MATDDGDIPPSATIYVRYNTNENCHVAAPLTTLTQVRNLDERVKIPKLMEALQSTFEACGTIVEIIAKKNIKAKGQAFVVFESADEAEDAIDTLQDFVLFDKPMQLAYAKTRSDATVVKEDGVEGLETHKKHRLAEKERKQALEAANAKPTKRAAADTLAERPAKVNKPANNAGHVPDEYLPPNKTLFLRELPEDYTKEMLAAVFRRFPGYKDTRMVPGREGIAFVEYENEDGAITAKEATTGITLGEKAIRVTFQRK